MAVALITGENSGIGQATAMLFAQRGYQVAIAARRTQPLEAAREAIAHAGGRVMSVTTDVSVLQKSIKW